MRKITGSHVFWIALIIIFFWMFMQTIGVWALLGLDLSIKRISTNESQIAEKTQAYLENKYKEKFIINEVQPITPQDEVYLSVSPVSNSKIHFSAVYTKKRGEQIINGDNYMLIKWGEEAKSLFDPLIANIISSNTFFKVSLPARNIFEYGDITLPLKEVTKKYPNLLLISIDVYYLMEKEQVTQFNDEIIRLEENLNKMNISNIRLYVLMYDRSYFGDINRFRGIAEEDITGILNSRRALIKEIYLDMDEPNSLNELQTKLQKKGYENGN
ncbi:hypothetical protein GC101_15485 [Paenibacillus sp. LMG 31459]|uniref:SAF domain-containing protein n=1 Tax=Paenibacillus phytohabitans TaxID=2654978 RepID=A0ABX1YH51_9BACL|nr:hypothetical protein [Paenibacillus phytohabitans]NOU80272.1 hypothetical protein [Paenibacillus phytohabitans]